eukprot:TRINITY_DN2842_c0_g1_i2.p1 TRINITY_DN2842_c0_g1~~TRINITY_DN2842_c0_g1_i2.p1  ORF type:complete len:108 (+),score=25.40 TRINITY_DN2842_c0_g1_i2:309-632(+)
MKDVAREVKLEAIVDTFAEDCILVPSSGTPIRGKDGVRAFYEKVLASSQDTFLPQPDTDSICVSDDGTHVAAEIHLPQISMLVGDFWTFRKGKIVRLVVYSRQSESS